MLCLGSALGHVQTTLERCYSTVRQHGGRHQFWKQSSWRIKSAEDLFRAESTAQGEAWSLTHPRPQSATPVGAWTLETAVDS
jgi:hypothetical protein